jgi:hypothetical protein
MEEKETVFVGIDAGKYHVDVAFGGQGEVKRFKNDDGGIEEILGLLKGRQVGSDKVDARIFAERIRPPVRALPDERLQAVVDWLTRRRRLVEIQPASRGPRIKISFFTTEADR